MIVCLDQLPLDVGSLARQLVVGDAPVLRLDETGDRFVVVLGAELAGRPVGVAGLVALGYPKDRRWPCCGPVTRLALALPATAFSVPRHGAPPFALRRGLLLGRTPVSWLVAGESRRSAATRVRVDGSETVAGRPCARRVRPTSANTGCSRSGRGKVPSGSPCPIFSRSALLQTTLILAPILRGIRNGANNASLQRIRRQPTLLTPQFARSGRGTSDENHGRLHPDRAGSPHRYSLGRRQSSRPWRECQGV